MVYIFHVVEEKAQKPVSFFKREETLKEKKAFEFIR